MIKTKKIVATALSAAMAASMCVAVPATAAFAADGAGTATATDGAQDGAALVDINDAIKESYQPGDQFYADGKAITPLESIKKDNTTTGNKLTAGKEYTVEYSNNTELGTGTAVLKGIESAGYTGTKTYTFNIIKFSFKVLYNGKAVNNLSRTDMEKLIADSADNTEDLYYQHANVLYYVPAKTYVTFNSLMASAGITKWTGVSAKALDGFGSDVTKEMNETGKYYPAQTKDSWNDAGAKNVPAIVATSYSTADIVTTAAEAEADAKANYADKAQHADKLFIGITESEIADGSVNMHGKKMATGVCRFSILGMPNTVKVSKAKAAVKKGKTVTVKVSKAQGKVTVSNSAKKVAKVTYAKKTNKITIKGLKKGKATITVKAAGDGVAQPGTKTIKVTVK